MSSSLIMFLFLRDFTFASALNLQGEEIINVCNKAQQLGFSKKQRPRAWEGVLYRLLVLKCLVSTLFIIIVILIYFCQSVFHYSSWLLHNKFVISHQFPFRDMLVRFDLDHGTRLSLLVCSWMILRSVICHH